MGISLKVQDAHDSRCDEHLQFVQQNKAELMWRFALFCRSTQKMQGRTKANAISLMTICHGL